MEIPNIIFEENVISKIVPIEIEIIKYVDKPIINKKYVVKEIPKYVDRKVEVPIENFIEIPVNKKINK